MKNIIIYPDDEWPDNFTGLIIYKDTYNDVLFKEYTLNGKIHREDGPAVTYRESGGVYWYLNGIMYDKDKWFEQLTQAQQVRALFNPENWQ